MPRKGKTIARPAFVYKRRRNKHLCLIIEHTNTYPETRMKMKVHNSMTTVVLMLLLLIVLAMLNVEVQASSRFFKKSNFCTEKTRVKADETLMQLTSLGEGSRFFPENQKQVRAYCR